ncbi:hypothetical protein VUR80DRAFT_5462 [Thermomyces stellatus]
MAREENYVKSAPGVAHGAVFETQYQSPVENILVVADPVRKESRGRYHGNAADPSFVLGETEPGGMHEGIAHRGGAMDVSKVRLFGISALNLQGRDVVRAENFDDRSGYQRLSRDTEGPLLEQMRALSEHSVQRIVVPADPTLAVQRAGVAPAEMGAARRVYDAPQRAREPPDPPPVRDDPTLLENPDKEIQRLHLPATAADSWAPAASKT